MDPFRRLEKGISVSMLTDEDGLTGRECPNPECLGYFKIKFGTGLTEPGLPCHCPYCGHTAGSDHFWTQDQLSYARSIMMRELGKAMKQWATNLDRHLKTQTRNGFIKLGMSYKESYHPIRYYREKDLETKIVCDNCTLEYAVYGVFAYCPDCGTHNSLQILRANFALAAKELELASGTDEPELSRYLMADALENVVSAFDGFGRQLASVNCAKAINPEQALHLSFQSINKARSRVQSLFGFDIADGLTQDDWEAIVRCFQKRHLLAHSMGVVDQAYVDAANDRSVTVGHKVPIGREEIDKLMLHLERLGQCLYQGLKS
jgi:hypothetical protein